MKTLKIVIKSGPGYTYAYTNKYNIGACAIDDNATRLSVEDVNMRVANAVTLGIKKDTLSSVLKILEKLER